MIINIIDNNYERASVASKCSEAVLTLESVFELSTLHYATLTTREKKVVDTLIKKTDVLSVARQALYKTPYTGDKYCYNL